MQIEVKPRRPSVVCRVASDIDFEPARQVGERTASKLRFYSVPSISFAWNQVKPVRGVVLTKTVNLNYIQRVKMPILHKVTQHDQEAIHRRSL
jgi:hypothetical protein